MSSIVLSAMEAAASYTHLGSRNAIVVETACALAEQAQNSQPRIVEAGGQTSS
jgi:hypothetical protein